MPIGYEQTYQLRTGDFDQYEHLQPASVLDICQDIAGANAERTPSMSFAEMSAAKLLWVTTRIKYEVVQTPPLHAQVKVRTWPLAPTRIGFQREYTMHSLDGELLVKCSSEWVMMSSETRSFVSARDVYAGPDDFSEETVFTGKLRRTRAFDATKGSGAMVKPSFSDIDVNGHVNNTKYANYILDALELGPDEAIKSFQIDYRHEIRLGDTVEVFAQRTDGGAVMAMGVRPEDGEKMFTAAIELA